MPRLVANIIPENARVRGKEIAITEGKRTFTFAEHYERIQCLAAALTEHGICQGSHLAILSRNCAEYLDIYGVCEMFGYVAVPINYRLRIDEVSYIVHNTQADVLFFAHEFKAIVEGIKTSQTSLHLFVQLDQQTLIEDHLHFTHLLRQASPGKTTATMAADAPVYIVHTSGTTGKPKGAVLNQAAQYGTAAAISHDAGIQEGHTGLIVQPLFHVGAKFLQLAHHVRGASIILHKEFDSQMIWQALETETINTLQLVPTMIHLLLEARQNNYPDMSLLHSIFYSTAPIRQDLLRQAINVFGDVFIQQYGSTESGLVSSLGKDQHLPDGTEQQQSKLLSAGQAYDNVQIEIRDTQNNTLKTHQIGEVMVKHDNMMTAYWRDEAATENCFAHGWLDMGDIGYLDDEGYLFLVDRKDDMIVSGGENIYPREVENILLQHPAVAEAAVIGIPDERWGEAVLACVVLKENTQANQANEDNLIAHCKRHIASYKKPAAVTFFNSLPRVATGKVNKTELRKPYWQRQQSAII